MRTRVLLLCAFMTFAVTWAGSAVAGSKNTPAFVPPCGSGTAGVRFVLYDNGTNVCDNVSGLVWEREPIQEFRTYQAAASYCVSKGTEWTLPALKDFYTLVDYANAFPPLPTGSPFVGIRGDQYWTSTPNVYYGGNIWTFIWDTGRTFMSTPEYDLVRVWCVRY